ncbi:hypothetical protein BJ508DRAFT_365321 [Ascobolus immersus RN42]|uniref:Uncharacterized protein n=1 Tax=Ascobolus immersus RN42 TaxID=1160509 RepID=A0A3N4HQB9_ASCIM|nr:hypothetical protein BJ508DRAFT_365321 [Ascobolus immersus RN42]
MIPRPLLTRLRFPKASRSRLWAINREELYRPNSYFLRIIAKDAHSLAYSPPRPLTILNKRTSKQLKVIALPTPTRQYHQSQLRLAELAADHICEYDRLLSELQDFYQLHIMRISDGSGTPGTDLPYVIYGAEPHCHIASYIHCVKDENGNFDIEYLRSNMEEERHILKEFARVWVMPTLIPVRALSEPYDEIGVLDVEEFWLTSIMPFFDAHDKMTNETIVGVWEHLILLKQAIDTLKVVQAELVKEYIIEAKRLEHMILAGTEDGGKYSLDAAREEWLRFYTTFLARCQEKILGPPDLLDDRLLDLFLFLMGEFPETCKEIEERKDLKRTMAKDVTKVIFHLWYIHSPGLERMSKEMLDEILRGLQPDERPSLTQDHWDQAMRDGNTAHKTQEYWDRFARNLDGYTHDEDTKN